MSGVVEALCVSERRGTSKTPVPEVEVRAAFGFVGDVHAGSAVRQVSIAWMMRDRPVRALRLSERFTCYAASAV